MSLCCLQLIIITTTIIMMMMIIIIIMVIVIVIINLIYIAQFDTNGILTALYIVISTTTKGC